MTGCKNCGEKTMSNRYWGKEVKTTPTETDETIEAFDRALEKDLPIDHAGPYSLDTLLSMKESATKIEFEKFKISLNKMTYDERIFHVISMVDIVNGEQYSPLGHSPIYCVCLLNKLLDFGEFSCVNEKFPSLRAEITKKFKEMTLNRVRMD